MIITCEECTTRFQLDDARVPEEGVRVRCSRCRHAFFVKSPTSVGDPVEAAVSRALEQEEEPAAGSTQELDTAAVLAARRGREGPADLDESDWKFNTGAGDAEESREDFAVPSGLDIGDGSIPEFDSVEAGLAAPAPDAALDAVDDLLGPAGSVSEDVDELFDTDPGVDEGIDALLAEGAPASAGEDRESVDAEPEPRAEPGHDAASPPGGTSAGALRASAGTPRATGDPLGEPAEWDFFSEEAAAAATAAPAARVAIGRVAVTDRITAAPLRPPIDVETSPSRLGLAGRRVGHGIGWALVAGLAALLLGRSLPAPRSLPSVAAHVPELAGLQVSDLEGHWLENAAGGSIYVISGELRSSAGERVPGARFGVRLLDARGTALSDEAAAVGPALEMAALRERAPAQLRARQQQAAGALAFAPFTPGRGTAFHAVLERVPENARSFELVATPVTPPPPAAAAPPAEASALGAGPQAADPGIPAAADPA